VELKSGTIFVKQKYKPDVFQTFGFRDIVNKLPVNPETSFPAGSLGKIFIAVGIMKLIESKKLTLESEVGNLFSYNFRDINPNVTVKQLLTHTSGIPDYSEEIEYPDFAKRWRSYPNSNIEQTGDASLLFIQQTVEFSKEKKFQYNDLEFVLLGLLIEEIAEQPFDEYINEIIFKPLGMFHTNYYKLDRLPDNCAYPYTYGFDKKNKTYYQNIYNNDIIQTGAKEAFTNAFDLHLFWEGLFNYTLLNEETTELLIQRHVALDQEGYGLGIWLDKEDNLYIVGNEPGVTCISYCDRQTKDEITIISNMQDNIFDLFYELKRQLTY